ncbi:mannosyl-oligosaccharide alpha-1,2-mannosidase [Ilyonectria robusta]
MLPHKLTILLLGFFAHLVSSAIYRPDYKSYKNDIWLSYSDYNKAREVREAFRYAWHHYIDYAHPNGTVPLANGSFVEDPYGWRAPLVFGLSTAVIMREVVTVNRMTELVKLINFHDTHEWEKPVPLSYAANYLGAMLSNYDLLSGQFNYLMYKKGVLHTYLDQAETLARTLSVAFDTPSGFPVPVVKFYPQHEKVPAQNTTLAELGSIMLEWVRLGDVSGVKDYSKKIEQIGIRLHHPMPRSSQPFSGLFANRVNLTDGWFLGEDGGWNDEGRLYYEALIKLWTYDPIRFHLYKGWWIKAADSVIENLQSFPDVHQELHFLSDFSGNLTISNSSRPACATGLNFIVGGMAVEEEKYVKFGLDIAETCWQIYRDVNVWPEGPKQVSAVELSDLVYNAFRATDDTKWQARAWELFKHLNTLHGAQGATRYAVFDPEWDYSDRREFTQDDPVTREAVWMGRILRNFWLMWGGPDDQVQVRREHQKSHGKFGNRYIYTSGGHPIQVYKWTGLNNFGNPCDSYLKKMDPFVKLLDSSVEKDNYGAHTEWKYAKKYKWSWRPESWEELFKGPPAKTERLE